jgi:hypothetical protein
VLRFPYRLIIASVAFSAIVSSTATGTSSPEPGPAPAPEARLLLGRDYPTDVSISFHKALLHWLDSLAMLTGPGGTGGKTTAAHREEYERFFGRPSTKDGNLLERFRQARLASVRGIELAERHRLTLAFFEATSLDQALALSGDLLDQGAAADLVAALHHFAPRYRRVWMEGAVPESFIARATDSGRHEELAGFLVTVAGFFGVSPRQDPRPQLVLAPVPSGFGTHAQAIGRFLLIEVRRDESLARQVAPIVHENVHFLFSRVPASRRDALERAALSVEPWGAEAWRLLEEALPTAMAQGVADRSFRREVWSQDQPWYHVRAVDRYAKRIYPLVEKALKSNGSFDEAFVVELVKAHTPAASRPPSVR